jgi:hypothetical protein
MSQAQFFNSPEMKEYVTGSKKLNQYPRQARQTA